MLKPDHIKLFSEGSYDMTLQFAIHHINKLHFRNRKQYKLCIDKYIMIITFILYLTFTIIL